jgi:hypothetical protein
MVLWLIWILLFCALMALPFLQNRSRTIIKKGVIARGLISGLLSIIPSIIFWKVEWRISFWLALPFCLLLLPDFQIAYKISPDSAKKKIIEMLKRTYCKFKLQGNSIKIEELGELKLYPGLFFTALLIKGGKTPKGKLIFGSIFKAIYGD